MDQDKKSPTADSQASGLDELRSKLSHAVSKDDPDMCRQVCMTIHEKNRTLGEPELRDPDNFATALHKALEGDHIKAAQFFIRYANEDFLMEEYEVSAGKLHTRKTCLHILAEKGNLDLMRDLLEKIHSGQQKEKYLRKTLLMEPAGQRPRPLPAIQIAALKGHTQLVEELVRLGVDVNSTNNKDDTAVLWAARGNHIQTVRRLIQLGAELNHQNDKGSTPLYWGVRYGFSDLVQVLVTEGAANIHQRRKLGLVSPVVLAAALGYTEILKILLKHGGDVNTQITNNKTALHFAATYGDEETLEALLENKAHVDLADDAGNTALLLATKEGHVGAMAILVDNGANVDCRNKLGQTAWSFAMERADNDLLKSLVTLYRQVKRMTSRKLVFPNGKTPLHLAALKGDTEKIQCLVELGTDLKCLDQSNNTFFHIAARENAKNVLEIFMSEVDVNSKNSDGDTALHLAAAQGHAESVQVLIRKAKLDITNKRGYTPLHSVCWSGSATDEVVHLLVDAIVKNNNWSLVNAQDDRGNTALHVAAFGNRSEIIPVLNHLNPSLKNNEGDNPLHVAAKEGNWEVLHAMLDVFNKTGHGLNINQQNGEGETLLHISAKLGDAAMLETLIATGADLEHKNFQGNTVLHELAEQVVLEPSLTEKILEVYNTITHCAALWWCIKQDLPYADEGSDVYRQIRRAALFFLTSEVHNKQGYNALCYSVATGALALFRAILNTKDVFRRRIAKQYMFDITSLTPDTLLSGKKAAPRKISAMSNTTSVGVIDDSDLGDDLSNNKSCLDIVASMRDEVLATQYLDLVPVKQLVQNLWARYQWMYMLLMIIHLAYMGCFTTYTVPLLAQFYGSLNSSPLIVYERPPNVYPVVLFLIWPGMLLMFEIVYCLNAIIRYSRRRKKHSVDPRKDRSTAKQGLCSMIAVTNIPGTIINWIFGYLSHLAAATFTACMMAWVVLYMQEDVRQVYPISLAVIIGWMFTIVFTKGFESVHAFSIMLSYIIVRDITRFLFIYVFVLVGFAVGLHYCFLMVPSIAANTPTVWHSLFLTFNLMLGMDEIFDESSDESYASVGGSAWYVRIIYLGYMILGTIILLNLLIAMLSDTYNDIKSKEGTTWRVGSVRLALRIERSMPCIRRLFTKMGIIQDQIFYDPDSRRWEMRLPMQHVQDEREAEVSEIVTYLQRLDNRIDHIQTAYQDLTTRVDSLLDRQQQGTSGQAGDGASSSSQAFRRISMAAAALRPMTAGKRRGLRRRETELKKP